MILNNKHFWQRQHKSICVKTLMGLSPGTFSQVNLSPSTVYTPHRRIYCSINYYRRQSYKENFSVKKNFVKNVSLTGRGISTCLVGIFLAGRIDLQLSFSCTIHEWWCTLYSSIFKYCTPNIKSLSMMNNCSILQNDGSDFDSMDWITTTPGFSFIPSASITIGLQIKTQQLKHAH